MELIFLRHTRPDIAEGVCYGRSDLGLAADHAAEAARLIRELPPCGRILTSPLQRCALLAQRIGQARGIAVEPDARLAEMDFGRWEGLAWDAIPRHELDAWAEDFMGARPHGGETVADLLARVQALLGTFEPVEPVEPVSEATRGSATARDATLIVTHAGVIKAALVATGNPDGWQARPGFGETRRIRLP
ncbi:MAG: histidine phosphatase family protein [Pseudomonadota bacterium]